MMQSAAQSVGDGASAATSVVLMPPKAVVYVATLGNIDMLSPTPAGEAAISEPPPDLKDDEGAGVKLMEFIGKGNLDNTRRMVVEWRTEPMKHAMGVLNYHDERENGFTPLIKAVSVGNVEICKCLLVEPYVLYNKQDASFKSALCHACEHQSTSHIAIIKLLLEKEGPEEGEKIVLDRALPLAVKANNVEAAKLLIAAGADLNESDSYGYSPLARAVSMGHRDMVALLVQQDDVEVCYSCKLKTLTLRNPASSPAP